MLRTIEAQMASLPLLLLLRQFSFPPFAFVIIIIHTRTHRVNEEMA